MKALLLSFFLLTGSFAFADTEINGANPAQPGSTEYYEVSWHQTPNPFTIVTWNVTGGTITSSSINPTTTIWCIVEWDNDPQTAGTLSVIEDLDGMEASIEVMPGGSYTPVISPWEQYINYGSTPTSLSVEFSLQPPSVSYQWELWNNTTQTWGALSGQTNSSYQPPPVFSNVKYRCVVDANGSIHNLESFININPFGIGSIILTPPTTSINYNTIPPITSTDAIGGFCYSNQYVYTWEYSIEDGPWTAIGSTSVFPSSAPPILGKTAIRRRVSCGGAELVSNTIVLNPAYTPTDFENRTYIREIIITKKGIVSWYNADAQGIGDKFQSTTYLDGLSRPIQTVNKGISPGPNFTWNDLVKHYEYDAAGRRKKDFIPYVTADNPGKFKTNATTAQPAYITSFFGEPSNAPTYNLVEFDESPLSIIKKSMPPGQAWAGSAIGVSTKTDFNNANEKVHIWNLTYSSSALPETSPTLVYSTGALLRNTTLDESQNKIITYSDVSGKLILKKVQETTNPGIEHSGWVCTYYVYDDFGNLRYTITPKAVTFLDNNNWNFNQVIADELCYKYIYDEKGQTIIKKQPGVGEEKMLYDKKGRVVLTQHANQDKVNNTTLSKNQWSFVLYDDLDRMLATGLLHNDASHSTLKGYIDGGSYQPSSATISAFAGSGNISLLVDYPVAGSSGFTNYLPGTDNIIFNSITHYDDYSYIGVKAFNNTYTLGYPGSTPNIEATTKTNRTLGMTTGEKVRILDGNSNNADDKFLFSSVYYDESGRALESLVDNHNMNNGSDADYQVNQYDFAGKLMSVYTRHKPNSSTSYTITSKNYYDITGRLLSVSKNFNNSFEKFIVEHKYDELGHLKTKRLKPDNSFQATELELITYDYNIRGWLTGINKDYALTENNYSQWDRYFAMNLAYNTGVTNPQLNGKIGGVIWKSQGDNTPRKFDFAYDKLEQLTSAAFKQRKKPSETTWSNSEVDFSTTVEYEDVNGNIKVMKHMGIIPGVNFGVEVDDLRYSYLPTGITNLNSNQLKQVNDEGELSANNNGLLGDFKEISTGQDYFYDKNGNLIKDLNKNIKEGSQNGIIYNYLNKPDKIVIDGKSTVKFTYDAIGEKLKKRVEYADGSARNTIYIGNYVYEEFIPSSGPSDGEQLQYILHDEGRVKLITPHAKDPNNNNDFDLNAGSSGILSWPGGKQGVFEYFIKDHLGSTRMVLTEEVQKEYYMATMEDSPSQLANAEEKLFGQVDPVSLEPSTANELQKTRLINQSIWPGNSSDVVKLTAIAPDKVMGPNMILKVMAGDIIRSDVKYYYQNNGTTGTNPLLNSLISSFINALDGGKASAIGKSQYSQINTTLSNNTTFSSFMQGHNEALSPPKAYLNIIFFDEQFKFIEADPVIQSVTGSNFQRVGSSTNSNLTLQQKAPKNGWVFVFVSNESDEPVYFDDFAVTQEHSRIAEENHFYPFGLKIGSICSKAINKLSNKYNYQGNFAEHEDETGWDEFPLRMYDPQIGRWTSSDPYDVFASGYLGMGNDPVNSIDPDGGKPTDWFYDANGNLVWLPNTRLTPPKGNYTWAFVEGPIYDPVTKFEMWGDMFGNKIVKELAEVVVSSNPFANWALHHETNPELKAAVAAAGTPQQKVVRNPDPPKPLTGLQKTVLKIHKYVSSTPNHKLGELLMRGPINDAYITIKSMGSGLGGYSKYGMTDMFGNTVGADKRIGAGLNTLSLPLVFANPGGQTGSMAQGAGRIFWAGGDEAMAAATNYAKSTGQTTIGMTRAGQNLEKLIQNRNIPWEGPGGAREMWARLSATYAKGAQEPVHFFPNPNGFSPGSIWVTVERPILVDRKITIITH